MPNPNGIPTQSENPDGYHARYIVYKANGEAVNPFAEYFVLRLDDQGRDQNHIAACRRAVLAYAEAIAPFILKLSNDLRIRYAHTLPPTQAEIRIEELEDTLRQILCTREEYDTEQEVLSEIYLKCERAMGLTE